MTICNLCGFQYEPQELRLGNHVIMSSCPACAEKNERDEMLKDEENKRLQHINWCNKLRVREEFYDKTLENFVAESESQKEALQSAWDLVNGKIKKLVLTGGNGIGKTHLEIGVLKKVGGIRYTAYELFALYRECYSAKAKCTELELIDELTNLPCLMIEEVGRTKGSEAELNFMSLLIDELHTKRKLILINSNKIRMKDCSLYITDKNNCKNCNNFKCFERFLDNDVLSRLNEESSIIIMKGRDYRRIS